MSEDNYTHNQFLKVMSTKEYVKSVTFIRELSPQAADYLHSRCRYSCNHILKVILNILDNHFYIDNFLIIHILRVMLISYHLFQLKGIDLDDITQTDGDTDQVYACR